jgi:hypothetical protein
VTILATSEGRDWIGWDFGDFEGEPGDAGVMVDIVTGSMSGISGVVKLWF